MTTTIVSSAAALTTALKAANAGDAILLAPGTYSPINLYKFSFTSDVTIASADPSRPAVLTGLNVTSSSHLAFRNLELRTDLGTESKPFGVGSSHDIRFTNVDIHGSLNGNPQDDRVGLSVRSSDKVTIEDSTFRQVQSGVSQSDNTHLLIKDNTFDGIQMDGVRGGGSSWVTISGNIFKNFSPKDGEHPDAIQFWTTNTTTSAHDITITDNAFIRGSGERAQGIFLGNELGIPYQNVKISGNLVAGSMYNGIYVYKASNVTVTDNTVVGFSDMKASLFLAYVDKAVVTGNEATYYKLSTGLTNATLSDNVTVPQVTDGGAAAYEAWSAGLGDVTSQAGSPTVNIGAGTSGADTLTGADGADTLTGGAGNDVYVVADGDKIIELAGGGIDTMRSGDGFGLPANVENGVLTGRLVRNVVGNSLDNSLVGNDKNNVLRGEVGADSLSGGIGTDTLSGGAGNDRLTGGSDADVFVFNGGKDVVTDFGAGGQADSLDVSALTAQGLQATLVDLGADTKVTFTSGDSITLLGVDPQHLQLTAVGYIFH